MTTILTLTMNPSLDIATSIGLVTDTIKLRCTQEQVHPGGGGINVSRIIHNLGGNSCALFPCGGYTGNQLQFLLEEEGLTSHALAIKSDTRQSFSVHETSSGKDYRFLLPGHTLDENTAQSCLSYISTLHPTPRYLVASGSLPPGISEDFYARVSKIAQSINCLFVLDTSGTPLNHALSTGGIYLFKPSLQELEEFTGQILATESAQIQAAHALIQTGQVKIVVLSLGSDGAMLVSAEGVLKAQSIPVTPVSTVGAGDSVVGGMVWALDNGMNTEQALRYGIASAAATITNPHGEMGRAADIHALIDQVRISKI
jgi:6-phosphofructokinase 2